MVLRQSCGANAGGLSQVSVTGCLSGSGSLASPLQVLINPTGLLHCTPNGLAYNGPTGVSGGGITFVTVTGCMSGSGIPGSPIALTLDPTGMITCGAFGLRMTTYPTGVGGGSGVPGAPLTSIQFNNGGAFGGSANLTWNGTGIAVSGAALTASSPALTLTQTWNSGTVPFTGILLNVNDTASSSTSKLLDLQVGGTSAFAVNKAGDLTLGFNGVGRTLTASVISYGGALQLKHAATSDDVRISTLAAGTPVLGFYDVSIARTQLHAEASNLLAQRRGANAQTYRLYNNYTSASIYERGVLDWQGTAGTFRIGTEQSGTGAATPLVLMTSGTPRISIANSGIITFNQTYAFPTSIGASGTTLVSNGTNALNWSKPDVSVTGCIGGSGTAVSPLNLRLDPTGLLTCGAAGLRLSNSPTGAGGGTVEYTSLKLNLTGGGTHADPVTAVDLVYNNASGTNTIDIRPIIYFNMGQVGALVADGSIDNQPRFIVPEGFQMEICRAYLTIGNPGSDDTTVQLQRYVATTDCTEPGTNGTPFSKDITSGCTWVRWTEVEGITMDSLTQLTFRVLTPGADASNLVAHFFARTTVCFEP